jgi:hypothetical protein
MPRDRKGTDVGVPGNQRTLEEMDLLFAADTPWVWDAERNYSKLAEENPQILQATRRVRMVRDAEIGLRISSADASTAVTISDAEKRFSMIASSKRDSMIPSSKRVSTITSSLPEVRPVRPDHAFDPRVTSFLWDSNEHIDDLEDASVEDGDSQATQQRCQCSQKAGQSGVRGPTWPIMACCRKLTVCD